MNRYLRTRVKSIHDVKSMDMTKVDVALKLCAKELRLNGGKRNRLKREKAIQTSIDYYRVIVRCKGHECNFVRAVSRVYK